MSQTLEQFQAYQTRLEQYDQAIALLYWDLQTAAPKDSIEAKLSAVGYFSTESFRLSTADEYGSLLKKLSAPEEYDQLSPAMQLTIRRNLSNASSAFRKPSTRNMSQKRHVPKKSGRQPRRLLISLYLRPIWIRSSP